MIRTLLRAGTSLAPALLLAAVGLGSSPLAQANQVSLVSPQGSTPLGLGGSRTPATSKSAVVASIDPFLEYTPFGPSSSIRVPYWKKHLPDNAANFSMKVSLSRPVGPGGALIEFQTSGTAIDGVHYQILAPNPLRLMPGTTQVEIPIDLIDSGEYYLERWVQIQLTQSFGVSIHPKESVGQLWIRPSVDPPTLTFGSLAYSVPAGSQVNVPIQLSHPSQERTILHYRVNPASTLVDYQFAASGSMIFLPGVVSGQLPFTLTGNAQPGERLLIQIEHERNGVRYVVPPLDQDLTTNPDLYPQEIHLDENMWTYSVGGIQQFEQSDLRNPPAVGPAMPGVPTDHITGGSFWEVGLEDQELVDLIPQADPNPILDPFSGTPLKIFTIAEAASQLVPYIRKSFNNGFCGGNTQLYSLPEYMRVSYYLKMPQGVDAPRGVSFFRVGVRIRSQDINHGITFRIGSQGMDAQGNPVLTVPTSLGPIGVWSTEQIHPATDRFGIVEDEYGVRIWYAHRLDPNIGWTHPVVGDLRFETPGVDKGNPIEYPMWLSTGDQSLSILGLNSIDDATGRGNLPYGFMWEISDQPQIFGDQLKRYFPKPGSWWEPIGNAVLDRETQLFFIVQ